VVRSYFKTARGFWQTATRLPSGMAPRPLQPLSAMKVSHCPVAGVHLIMSPFPMLPPLMVKLEKKNAPWLVTQVGPSFQPYLKLKPPHTAFEGPAFGASKGPT